MKVKHEQIGEDVKLTLAKMAADPNVSLEEMKIFCIEVINKGVSSKAKKQTFIREVNDAHRKDIACWPVYNYILAGEGKKVG